MGQLAASGYGKQKEIADAFGVSVQTVRNNMKRYRESGVQGFFMPRTPCKLRVIDEDHRIKAGKWLAEGRTVSEVARRLAVDRKTLQRYINRGLIPGMNPASRSSSDDRDHEVDDPAASTTDQVPSGKNDDAREEATVIETQAVFRAPVLVADPIDPVARNDDTPPDAAVPADAVCSLDHHRAEPDQNDTREIERPSPDAAGPARPAAGLDEEPLDQADPAANDVAAPGVNEPLATGPGSGNTVPALRCSVPWPGQDRAERNRASGQTPMGMATSNGDGRVAASLGCGGNAAFDYRSAASVQNGGVLCVLPSLIKTGVIETALQNLPPLKGYYSLLSIILTLCFTMLARLPNAEALRYQPPGEWGLLIGHDRCPEVKTLRHKIQAIIADPTCLREWIHDLIRHWLKQTTDTLTLCVDGHVKVYSGRKGTIPKGFVSRQKLCLPAAVSYWLNALDGTPFLCVHEQINPKLSGSIINSILPELKTLSVIPEEPENILGRTSPEPNLLLIFDREGWDRTLFRHLAMNGVACITWRKGSYKVWPEEEFDECQVTLHGPCATRDVPMRLAERGVMLTNKIWVREIRFWSSDGRQPAIISTHRHMTAEQITGCMRSRWVQENFFKYMGTDFNFDSLTEKKLCEVDPDCLIVNPQWRHLDKQRKALDGKINRRRVKLSKIDPEASDKRSSQLRSEIEELEKERNQRVESRNEVDRKIRVGDLPEGQAVHALPVDSRYFLDYLRMAVYRAETDMAAALIAGRETAHRARAILRALFQSDADLLVDKAAGTLTVQLHHLANHAHDAALKPLLAELNETQTICPGTDLQLVYTIASVPADVD